MLAIACFLWKRGWTPWQPAGSRSHGEMFHAGDSTTTVFIVLFVLCTHFAQGIFLRRLGLVGCSVFDPFAPRSACRMKDDLSAEFRTSYRWLMRNGWNNLRKLSKLGAESHTQSQDAWLAQCGITLAIPSTTVPWAWLTPLVNTSLSVVVDTLNRVSELFLLHTSWFV